MTRSGWLMAWGCLALAWAPLLVVAPGCTQSSRACTPGVQQACACPGGGQGAQVCTSDGQAFGACEGCGGSSSGGSGGGGSGWSGVSQGSSNASESSSGGSVGGGSGTSGVNRSSSHGAGSSGTGSSGAGSTGASSSSGSSSGASGAVSASGGTSTSSEPGEPIGIPATGQTTSYAPSDDGNLHIGVAWPTVRFTTPSGATPVTGGIVLDALTGLLWAQDGNAPGPEACAPGAAKTYTGAATYIACLNTNSYLGHTDWRLPNRHELRSLVNYGEASSAAWLSARGFTNIRPDPNVTQMALYWTSTVAAGNPADSWIMSIDSGVMSTGMRDASWEYSVIPVCGGQVASSASARVPKTGQTGCYDPSGAPVSCDGMIQDGAWQAGAAWPNPRFTSPEGSVPVTGELVLDRLTGLTWSKDANAPGPGACSPGVTKTFQEALDYVACLNTNTYLGQEDWRLPNVNEIGSLVNLGQQNSAVWLQQQGFSSIWYAEGGYITSTTNATNTTQAWYASFWGGALNNDSDKQYALKKVWPVCGGR